MQNPSVFGKIDLLLDWLKPTVLSSSQKIEMAVTIFFQCSIHFKLVLPSAVLTAS